MNMSAYQPCVNYASKLSSCAAATQGFDSTDEIAQASCVCYTSSASCAAPTWNTAYDDHAFDCYDYLFDESAYTNVADALADPDLYLGVFFCEWISSELVNITATGLLLATLSATCSTTAVPAQTTAPSQPVNAVQDPGNAAVLLTSKDRGVLVRALHIKIYGT